MRVALLGRFDGAAAARLRTDGHEVVLDPAEGPVATAAEGADLVLTRLADDRAGRRVYTELARTASPGQVFADLSPLSAALQEWCALALPAFLAIEPGGDARGEPDHLERARPVLEALAGPLGGRGRLG